MTRCRFILASWIVLVLFGPQRAEAHLVSTELGPFYDGAAHPLVTPEDLLTILVLALFAGLGGAVHGRRSVLLLVAGWTLGMFTAFGVGASEIPLAIFSTLVLIVAGLAVATNLRLPEATVAVIAAIIGLVHGVSNGAAAYAADGQWLSVVGIASGVFALAMMLTGFCVWLAGRGAPLVLRVAGSWVGAIALLKMGWELQG